MNNLTTISGDTSQPWYKNPKIFGKVSILGIIAVIAYFFGVQLFAGVMGLLGAMWGLIALSLTVGAVVYFSPLVLTAFDVAAYKLTNMFYSIDPIAVAWTKLKKFGERIDNIAEACTTLKGQLSYTKGIISKNNKEIEENLENSEIIIKSTKLNEEEKSQAEILISKNQDLENWNKELNPLQDTISVMLDGMTQIKIAATTQLKKEENSLKILEQKYESVKVTWGAISKAKGLFGGADDLRNEYERSLAIANKQISMRLAGMDDFIEMATPMIQNANITKQVNDEKVQNIIAKIKSGEFNQKLQEFRDTKLKFDDSPLPSVAKLPGNTKYEELL